MQHAVQSSPLWYVFQMLNKDWNSHIYVDNIIFNHKSFGNHLFFSLQTLQVKV